MKKEILFQLYESKQGRKEILHDILKEDNISIAEIVALKESALNEKLERSRTLTSELAFRATMIFSKKKDLERVKPLIAKNILETGVLSGSEYEKILIEIASSAN